MSTTDTKAILEAWAKSEGLIHESHGVMAVSSTYDISRKAFYAGYQAATEAAKATGTAGEQTKHAAESIEKLVTPIVTGIREFYLGVVSRSLRNDRADVLDIARSSDSTYAAYVGVQGEFAKLFEAARQPAPADEIEQVAKAIYQLLPSDGQGSPIDHPWQPGGNSHMQDLARHMARAALAARSQP